MRLIFAGTPEFARTALEQLHSAGFEIALVLTQPDRPAGRGMKLQASSVKQWAQDHQLPVVQPRSLRLDGQYPEDAAAARLAMETSNADVMVVAAYGLILPQWVLTMMAGNGLGTPKFGCLNIHASLLPRWRGAAPIHRAIEAGDTYSGVTIMQMDAGLDTGDMLLLEKLPIAFDDTTASLHDKLAMLGGQLVVKALKMATRGKLTPVKQPPTGITYAHKIEKSEAVVDWSLNASVIVRRIRAFNPFPGTFSLIGQEVIKLRQAQVLEDVDSVQATPGQVLAASAAGVDVATGSGIVRITCLQKAGGKVLTAAHFLRGHALSAGMMFSPAPTIER